MRYDEHIKEVYFVSLLLSSAAMIEKDSIRLFMMSERMKVIGKYPPVKII
jgi:hypothetical protein